MSTALENLAFLSGLNALGLKRFAVHFQWDGRPKTLRLTGYSEKSVLGEFEQHFTDVKPTRVELLGVVG